MATGPAQGFAPPIVHEVLSTPGQPLDGQTRAAMEPRFGHDFSQVRVHTGSQAAESARAVNALAYTVGRNVVFAGGQYAPGTRTGQQLLAHELTHVVQQSALTHTDADLKVGAPDDTYEREAAQHSAALTAGLHFAPTTAAPASRVQRSALSTFLDIVLFVPRLFGLEVFPIEDLRAYLNVLRQRRGPEGGLFSDNKARACVSREPELGPYDAQTKIWLIEDMLRGWTSSLDEGSIIVLLRRSGSERQQIVSAIGRDRLWANFSGKNRLVIEALTLTAADAGNTLVSRLRNLAPEQLHIYAANTNDPAVQQSVRQAMALSRITAPVPADATIDQSGKASFQINGIDIVAEPDTSSSDEKYRDRAFTSLGFQHIPVSNVMIDPTTNTILSFTAPRIRGTVKTTFGPGYNPSNTSGYGRGTTREDKASGRTTLRFHESQHSESWFQFIRENQPPVFGGAVGMSERDFQRAEEQFIQDYRQYHQRAFEYSVRMTDCPGTPATDEQLGSFGLSATICHQQ
ncbi:MAG: hypothetical protein OHK0022_31570 [Roseiflexaceae bacterium]